MECEMPLVNSNPEEMKEIFESVKTIAILGLSPNETKASNMVARYLQNAGYKIVPVYPKEEEILGEKVYRSLEEIPFEIDMVNIFRKPNAFDAVAATTTPEDKRCVTLSVKNEQNKTVYRVEDNGRFRAYFFIKMP